MLIQIEVDHEIVKPLEDQTNDGEKLTLARAVDALKGVFDGLGRLAELGPDQDQDAFGRIVAWKGLADNLCLAMAICQAEFRRQVGTPTPNVVRTLPRFPFTLRPGDHAKRLADLERDAEKSMAIIRQLRANGQSLSNIADSANARATAAESALDRSKANEAKAERALAYSKASEANLAALLADAERRLRGLKSQVGKLKAERAKGQASPVRSRPEPRSTVEDIVGANSVIVTHPIRPGKAGRRNP